jgi:hypothetical protein
MIAEELYLEENESALLKLRITCRKMNQDILGMQKLKDIYSNWNTNLSRVEVEDMMFTFDGSEVAQYFERMTVTSCGKPDVPLGFGYKWKYHTKPRPKVKVCREPECPSKRKEINNHVKGPDVNQGFYHLSGVLAEIIPNCRNFAIRSEHEGVTCDDLNNLDIVYMLFNIIATKKLEVTSFCLLGTQCCLEIGTVFPTSSLPLAALDKDFKNSWKNLKELVWKPDIGHVEHYINEKQFRDRHNFMKTILEGLENLEELTLNFVNRMNEPDVSDSTEILEIFTSPLHKCSLTLLELQSAHISYSALKALLTRNTGMITLILRLVRLKEDEAGNGWKELFKSLPQRVPQLYDLVLLSLDDDEVTFPRLTGRRALRGVQALGFHLETMPLDSGIPVVNDQMSTLGLPTTIVLGVHYHGKELAKAVEYLARAIKHDELYGL